MIPSVSPADPSALGYLRRLVYETTAIVLDDNKDYLFEARLGPILRQEGLATFDALVSRLSAAAADAGPLRRRVVEAMTTNETSFFRDVRPFEALRYAVLPRIAAAWAGERGRPP